MLLCACAYGVKSEISLDTSDSASNAVVKRYILSIVINQHCAECVCLYDGLRVCGQKYIIIIQQVTVCENFVPRLDMHDDVFELTFMKIAPPEIKSSLRPWWDYLWCCMKRHYCPSCSLFGKVRGNAPALQRHDSRNCQQLLCGWGIHKYSNCMKFSQCH